MAKFLDISFFAKRKQRNWERRQKENSNCCWAQRILVSCISVSSVVNWKNSRSLKLVFYTGFFLSTRKHVMQDENSCVSYLNYLILFVASECINTDIDVPQQTDIIDAKNISPQQLQVKRPIPPKKSMWYEKLLFPVNSLY